MYQGVTGLGPNPDIKETYDLVIDNTPLWKEEDDFICQKLSESVNEYYSTLKKTVDNCIVFHDVVNMNMILDIIYKSMNQILVSILGIMIIILMRILAVDS